MFVIVEKNHLQLGVVLSKVADVSNAVTKEVMKNKN